MPELKIEKLIRLRLSQLTGVKPVSCRFCGEDIIFLNTKGGSIPLDMELKLHRCRSRKEAM